MNRLPVIAILSLAISTASTFGQTRPAATWADAEKALAVLERASRISLDLNGPQSLPYAASLANLGVLHYELEQYDRAEPLLVEALDIQRKVLGENHPDLAVSMSNLAGLYQKICRYDKAEALYLAALRLRENALGQDSPALAATLHNLTSLYCDTGQYAKAEPPCRRALAIQQKALGDRDPAVARSLNALARICQKTGRPDQAEQFYNQALDIRTQVYGGDHPEVARVLNNLGDLLEDQGKFRQSLPMYERSLDILTRAYGPEHPELAAVLANLASARAAVGDNATALDLLARCRRIVQKQTDLVLGFTPLDAQLNFLSQTQGYQDMLLSLVSQRLSGDPAAVAIAANSVLRSKGMTLELLTAQNEAASLSGDAGLTRLHQELGQVCRQIAQRTWGQTPTPLGQAEQSLADLEKRKENLEGQIGRASREFLTARMTRQADVESVAAAVPSGGVLLEFVRAGMFDFRASGPDVGRIPTTWSWSSPPVTARPRPGRPGPVQGDRPGRRGVPPDRQRHARRLSRAGHRAAPGRTSASRRRPTWTGAAGACANWRSPRSRPAWATPSECCFRPTACWT